MADDRSDDENPPAEESGTSPTDAADERTAAEEPDAATDPLTDVETDTRTRTVPDEDGSGTAERAGDAGSAPPESTTEGTTPESGARGETATPESVAEGAAGSDESENVSPAVAALLSLVIPGVGHYFGGMKNRAVYWFAGVTIYYIVSMVLTLLLIGLLLLLLAPVLHIACAADAYIQTNE